MDIKKFAFILVVGICTGYPAFSFAADLPAKKPAVAKPSAKPDAHDMKDHADERKGQSEELKGGTPDSQACCPMCGMKGNQTCCQMCGQMGGMKGSQMCGQMGGMKGGQMCGQMGGMKGGQMCGQMGGMKGSQTCGQMCGQMGGKKGSQMCGQMCGQMGSHEGMHMGGMMGSYEHGMMMKTPHIDMVMMLDLSDEQRYSINKLSDELKHNNWVTMGAITDESAKLRDLYAADKRDPSTIGKEYQKIFDMERQMIEATVDTQNRIEDLLTPEQRTRLKDMHHKMEPMRCYQKQ